MAVSTPYVTLIYLSLDFRQTKTKMNHPGNIMGFVAGVSVVKFQYNPIRFLAVHTGMDK
jgi:hypothetical protein